MPAEAHGRRSVGEIGDLGGHEVHRADEVGEERGPRVVIDLPRRAGLLDLARVHYGDPV